MVQRVSTPPFGPFSSVNATRQPRTAPCAGASAVPRRRCTRRLTTADFGMPTISSCMNLLPSSLSVEQALATVQRIGPSKAWFTHMCHDLPHAATCARLPGGVELAYDGLTFEIDL